MKNIYDLKLHESVDIGKYEILRVPGGWLYTIKNFNVNSSDSPIFVPFDNEFIDVSGYRSQETEK